MIQFSDWILANWFELGILLVLSAILATAAWFARNVLKSLRASQEQVGALLRLCFSDQVPSAAIAPPSAPASEAALHERVPRGPNPVGVFGGKLVDWLNAPMRSQSESPWDKFVRWLQAPAGS